MTQTNRPVKRETFSAVRTSKGMRPIIVELNPTFVRIRLKGLRHTFTVTYDQIYKAGAENEAAARRREKAECKRARLRAGDRN